MTRIMSSPMRSANGQVRVVLAHEGRLPRTGGVIT
ncbi:hypothetical protein SAMN05216276_1001224 [Streptosporangium subroseum]|uniref:Uncharacterized protein n=1 Tax=Streptosporangium subroseum TaxID=106412 RepID=A0A239A9B8_9ACTN|nr:hypothetical protein SAMN05216276_1001224 [Streptosporangium subroseum]